MRFFISFSIAALVSIAPAKSNNWEKYYTSYGPTDGLIPSAVEPELIPFSGDLDRDFENMWRKGFVAIGYTHFNSPNEKTKDATKLAKKLKVRYYIVATDLSSSTSSSIPLTTPTTNTSHTTGHATATGQGGTASGTYSGTTTTYGTQTTYIPITINRFDKIGLYFMEVPEIGAGIMPRELTADEVTKYETRRAFAVKWVRDNSPAYLADLLPNDVIIAVNGQPADAPNWQVALRGTESLQLKVMRNGSERAMELIIPPERRPK